MAATRGPVHTPRVNARWIPLLALAASLACDGKTEAPKDGEAKTESAAAKSSTESLPDRDPALAHRLVEEEQGVVLDVRTSVEYATGHIDGATNISHDELAERIGEVGKLTGGDKSRPIVVYCRSGKRAGMAKKVLTEAGYEQVTNLGGLSDW